MLVLYDKIGVSSMGYTESMSSCHTLYILYIVHPNSLVSSAIDTRKRLVPSANVSFTNSSGML